MGLELSSAITAKPSVAATPVRVAPLSVRDREVLGRMEEAARFAKAAPAVRAEKPDDSEATRLADGLKTARDEQRAAAKRQAQEKVQQLLDRLRLLKQFASDNPAMMAKQLAEISKELKKAVAAYAAAGGKPTGAMSAPANAAPSAGEGDPSAARDASPEEAARAAAAQVATGNGFYKALRESLPGETIGDMDFIKFVKAVMKKMREFLDTAKIQTAIAGPDDETKENFEITDATLKEIDEALDKMARDLRDSSPAAGMFIALHA